MSTPPTFAQLHDLAARVARHLSQQQLTLALAESCTGGLLASLLTDIPGSSQFLVGGVVAYSNFAKTTLLNIDPELLETHGAVSAQVARAMAHNARQSLQTELALGVTGITGPGGGTPEKPVGLVYLHLLAPHADQGAMHLWPHDREGNKRANVAAGLHMILRYVEQTKHSPTPSAAASQQDTLLVEASWRNGNWRPQAVWLHGRRLQVIGVGRQERTAAGVWVMTVEFSNGDRAELEVDADSGVWRLRRHWPGRRYA